MKIDVEHCHWRREAEDNTGGERRRTTLEERGVERGSARQSSLRGRERVIVSQTNIGTISKPTLGKLLRVGVERIWAFLSAKIPS